MSSVTVFTENVSSKLLLRCQAEFSRNGQAKETRNETGIMPFERRMNKKKNDHSIPISQTNV